MIGVIIFCHGDMASGTRHAAELIIGPQSGLETIDLQPGTDLAGARAHLEATVAKVDDGDGVLVLTDLPGGTPSNVTALRLDDRLEMLAGFNLPSVVKVLMGRHVAKSPRELARAAVDHGCCHVITGEDMLRGVSGDCGEG